MNIVLVLGFSYRCKKLGYDSPTNNSQIDSFTIDNNKNMTQLLKHLHIQLIFQKYISFPVHKIK